MVRANSAWKIAGPRHGTTSMRTLGARRVTFSISGGIRQLDREVRHHQAELPLAARGVEVVGHEQPAHLVERLRQRRAQRLCPRRQLHPRAGAHQQRIAEDVAQALQRVTAPPAATARSAWRRG